MKALKRTTAILLAVLLVAAGSAFAASIEVTTKISNATYSAYKIFDVVKGTDTAKDTYVYSILSTNPWYDVVTEYIKNTTDCGITLTASTVEGEDNKYYVTFDESYTGTKDTTDTAARKFAEYLRVHIPDDVTADGTGTSGTITEGSATVTIPSSGSLDNGYYLVLSSYGTSAALVTAEGDNAAEVDEKNSLPAIEKKVVTDTGALDTATTAKVGETVTFYTTIYVDNTSNSDYVIHDTMSPGLTLDPTSIKLYLGEKSDNATDWDTWAEISSDDGNNWSSVNPGTETVEADKCTFEVTIKNSYITGGLEMGQPIRIEYTATVNESAVSTNTGSTAGDQEKNDVYLIADNTTKTTTTVTVNTYGFSLVKTDSNDVILEGAEFKLYDSETGETPITLVKVTVTVTDAEGNVTDTYYYYRPKTTNDTDTTTTVEGEDGTKTETKVETVDVITAGNVKIVGLEDGKYYLEETKEPAGGYNKLTARQEIEISGADRWATIDEDGYYTSGGLKVENLRGTTVPETGGVGTTIFYVLGSILLVGAGVILVTRRRMAKR